MNADTLPADLIAAADDVADWAVEHAAEAGQHPTLPTVAGRFGWDAPTVKRHNQAAAAVQAIAATQHRSRVAQALALYRQVQEMV